LKCAHRPCGLEALALDSPGCCSSKQRPDETGSFYTEHALCLQSTWACLTGRLFKQSPDSFFARIECHGRAIWGQWVEKVVGNLSQSALVIWGQLLKPFHPSYWLVHLNDGPPSRNPCERTSLSTAEYMS
jgi:hypothetical protein